MRTKLFLFLIICINAQIYAQKIDSLKALLVIENDDTIKANYLIQISEYYLFKSPDTAAFYGLKVLDLDTTKISALNLSKNYSNIGVSHAVRGEYPLSTFFFNKALKIQQQNKLKKGIGVSYNNLGNVHRFQGDLPKALEFQLLSLKIKEELQDSLGISSSYNNIGNIHDELENYEKAYYYYEKSAELCEKLNNKKGYARALNNMASVLSKQNKTEEARINLEKALKIREEIGDEKGISSTLLNIAGIYNSQGEFIKAIGMIEESIVISEKLNDKNGLVLGFLEKASIEKALEKDEKAIISLKKAEKIGLEIKDIPKLSAIYNLLSEINEDLGRYELALLYRKSYVTFKDSLYNVSKTEQLLEMDAKYQNEAKQKEIELTAAKLTVNEKEKEKLTLLKNGLIIGFIFILFIVLIILYLYRGKHKANTILKSQRAEIELKNKELEKLSIVAREIDNTVIIADKDGRIEFINESYIKMYGYSIAEFRAMFGSTLFNESDNPEIKTAVAKCFKEKKSVTYTLKTITKLGEEKWVQTTMTPILVDDEVHKMVLIDSDFTKIKKAEEEISKKNLQITDSIDYAKRIQNALLPDNNQLTNIFTESFIYFKPKDIVSGDFYWMHKTKDKILLAVADCTGHGVPGAFMSLIGINTLNKIVGELGITEPNLMLDQLSIEINNMLRKDNEEDVKDGMDLVICAIDLNTLELNISGAHNSVYIVRNNDLKEIKTDKFQLGNLEQIAGRKFTLYNEQLKKGDSIYLFSDGYPDQKGGEKSKKFFYQPFRNLFIDNQHKTMQQQQHVLDETLITWKGNVEQYDDILIMGIKI